MNNRYWERLRTPVAALPLIYVRVATGVIFLMKMLGLESIFYQLMQGETVKRERLNHTFTAASHYRIAGYHLPYDRFSWLPVPSLAVYQGVERAVFIVAIFWIAGYGLRYVSLVLTGLYGYLFFLSQLSYHHHTWLFLCVFGLFCIIPYAQRMNISLLWEKTTTLTVPRISYVYLQVLVATVYLFSFLSKLDPAWRSGAIMELFLWGDHWLTRLIEYYSFLSYQFVTLGVIGSMFLLSWGLFWDKTRRIALIVGVLLHLLIDASLNVGTYSYQMIVLYLVFFVDYWESDYSPVGEKTSKNAVK